MTLHIPDGITKLSSRDLTKKQAKELNNLRQVHLDMKALLIMAPFLFCSQVSIYQQRGAYLKVKNNTHLIQSALSDTLNGEVKRYSKSGILLEKAFYAHGLRDGITIFYYNNGVINSEDTYKNGRLNGLCRRYDNTGRIDKEFTCTEGLLNGPWTRYIKGTKFIEANFKQGKIDGWYYDFYRNGSIQHKAFYNEGKIVSGEFLYLKNGSLKYEAISNKIGNQLVMKVNYDEKGNTISRQKINELPVAFFIFGESVF